MNFRSIFFLVFCVAVLASCKDEKATKAATTTKAAPKETTTKTSQKVETVQDEKATVALQTTKSFLAAKNAFDTKKLMALTGPDYKELFKNKVVEVQSRKDFLEHIGWAKELSAVTKINEVVSQNDSIVEVVEESHNYIDTALGRENRIFKVTYYVKDEKVQKISYDFLPEKNYNNPENGKLYDNFERFCKERKIPYSWEPTPKDAKILREALEAYARQ
jgi:hypothetical protein